MKSLENDEDEKTLIVERNEMFIKERQCQVVNFIDITAYKKLEQEKENYSLLKTLNTTVHHEMLAPLHTNV